MGLFKKYDIDFDFIYIPSSSTATAAILGGNVEVGLLGGVGIVNAYVSGATDLVFIGSIKNVMTQSMLAKPEITKLEQLRGKRIGVTRIGSNTHYFTVQVFRRAGMNPDQRYHIYPDRRRSGDPGRAHCGSNRCGDVVAAKRRASDRSWVSAMWSLVPISGFPTRRPRSRRADPMIAKRGPVLGRFMRAMAEASKSMHRDRELVYRVMEKKLRIKDRKVLDDSYAIEMKVMEPRLELKARRSSR